MKNKFSKNIFLIVFLLLGIGVRHGQVGFCDFNGVLGQFSFGSSGGTITLPIDMEGGCDLSGAFMRAKRIFCRPSLKTFFDIIMIEKDYLFYNTPKNKNMGIHFENSNFWEN